jgi:acyl transferase domain-containing protein
MKPFAFVFPGQGSQAVGMLEAWGDNAAVRQTLEEASTALGEDIAKLIREGPKERLDLTANTQPAMLTAGIACYRAWLAETKLAPEVVAGHSLGEYTALVAAGAISLAEALPLVRFRAEAMQDAVPVGAGAMAAVLGLDAAAVRAGCAAAREATGEVVLRRQLQRSAPDRDRRQQGRRRQGLRAAQGGGRQADAAPGGLRAVPLAADEAGGGSAAREAGGRGDRRGRRSRSSTTSTCASRPSPR